jgi:uncharacterized protein
MRVHLPDVNVLVALHDEMHEGHQRAHHWLVSEGRLGWATTPFTEVGFVRVFSQPATPNNVGTPGAALDLLLDMVESYRETHHFWSDSVSLRDMTLFRLEALRGHRQITDTYLLGLCQRNKGTLVTLDQSIALAAIIAPHPELVRVL